MPSSNCRTLTLGWLWPIALAMLTSGSGGSALSSNTLTSSLNGAQEIPPNVSAATASGTATVSVGGGY